MSFYAGRTITNGSVFHDWVRDCFVGEAGWSVLRYKAVDSAGVMVTAIQNTTHGFVIVLHRPNTTTDRVFGWISVAEAYDFTARTVTNPCAQGTFAPLSGDRAYASPVTLSATTSSTDAFMYVTTTVTSPLTTGGIVTPDTFGFTMSLGGNTATGVMLGAMEPLAPSIEPTASPLFFVARDGSGTFGGISRRVSRSPLSSTFSGSGVSWNVDYVPWHTASDWGADAYAPDATALPSTRCVIYRQAGATDGLGIARGLVKGFRPGVGGTLGQQMTDDDGVVWRWNEGAWQGKPSGGYGGQVGVLPGWWRVS